MGASEAYGKAMIALVLATIGIAAILLSMLVPKIATFLIAARRRA